jgi:DNA-binding NtrC family response regulator
LAARLQAIAESDAIVISGSTHRLVRGLFQVRDLGPQVLKGAPAPMPVYQALAERTAQSRLDVAMTMGFTRLIGREREAGLLLDRWEQVAVSHVLFTNLEQPDPHPEEPPRDLEERGTTLRLGRTQRLTEVVEDLERRMLTEALQKARGNQSVAARELGMTEQSLRYRMRKYGLPSPRQILRLRRNLR